MSHILYASVLSPVTGRVTTGNLPVTGDGTWCPVRHLKQKQMYVLTVQFRKKQVNDYSGRLLLTIPVVYIIKSVKFIKNDIFCYLQYSYRCQCR